MGNYRLNWYGSEFGCSQQQLNRDRCMEAIVTQRVRDRRPCGLTHLPERPGSFLRNAEVRAKRCSERVHAPGIAPQTKGIRCERRGDDILAAQCITQSTYT
jgi:hypothetical protein